MTEVNRVLQEIPPESRVNTEFIVGMFLRNHGTPEDSRAYLRHAAESPHTFAWMKVIAADMLRSPEPAPPKVNPRSAT